MSSRAITTVRARAAIALFALRLLYNPLVSPLVITSFPLVSRTTLELDRACVYPYERTFRDLVVATRNYLDSSSHATQRRGNVVEAEPSFFLPPPMRIDEEQPTTRVALYKLRP